ncbi:MAG TPA: AI-2E family transporter [Terracidiphilus sp.]|nr:AI-2E family transporter [Terracidiphilus sp.]
MVQSARRRRSVRGDIVFVFALALALYVAWLMRGVLALLYVSALFAVVLSPVVRATAHVRIGRWRPFHGSMAILILLLAVAGALTAFGFLALPPVINDLQSLTAELPTKLPGILDKLQRVPFADRIDASDIISWIQRWLSSGAAFVLVSFKSWAGALVEVVAGFVLTLYFILEGDIAYRWFLSFWPEEPRERLDRTLLLAASRMEKWLVGQLALMLILGTVSTVVYLSLGVRYAYVLGIITGLLNVVPVLGATVSLLLALLVAAIDGWGRVIGVVVFFAVYFQVENTWLTPRIMQSRVNLPALGIFVALIIGSTLGGIAGAMVAIPTAVLVSVLLDEYLVRKPAE